jgi:repressor LexA
MTSLTEQQRAVLHYIREYIHTKGYPPSIREVAVGTKLRSQSSVSHHLHTLERLGYLERDISVSRGLRLLPPPEEADQHD